MAVHHYRRTCLLVVLTLVSCVMTVDAATPAANASLSSALASAQPVTRAESLENLGRLYQNKNNPVLQELWFLGRYHGQQHWSDANRGPYEESWENRRLRFGAQAKFFNKLTLHAQMLSGTDLEPFYGGFTELWAQWSFSDALNFTVGQQKHRFSHERNVSSRYMNYLERSMLTNMFALDYTPAVTLSGKIGRFNYYTGVFSNATSRSIGRSFTDFDSGWSFLANLTYDLGKSLGTDTAFLNVNYLRSDPDASATLMNRFEHGVAAAWIFTEGPLSLVTEVMSGLGGTRGDAHGLNLQPGLFLTDKFQIVARYQLAISDQRTGLTAQRRYERNVGLNTGDFYRAGYVGLNYYIAGHRLKLITGVEYSKMGDRDCWTGMAAVRLFWGPHAQGPFPMAQTLEGMW